MPFDLNFAAARAALDQYLAYLPGLSNPDRRPAPGTPYAQAFVPGTWQPVAPRARPQVGRANAYYSSEGPYWVSHHLDERSSEATHYEAAALAIWGELRGLGLLARLPADVPLRLLLSGPPGPARPGRHPSPGAGPELSGRAAPPGPGPSTCCGANGAASRPT